MKRLKGIHWVIVGGESGHGARPMNPEWARAVREACHGADVAFFRMTSSRVTSLPLKQDWISLASASMSTGSSFGGLFRPNVLDTHVSKALTKLKQVNAAIPSGTKYQDTIRFAS